MNKILTIAIPAYNMELYLSRCLESVLLSELQEKIDVLLINDGSKDQTLSIANEYREKYPEMLRVIDKPNGGWGTVINRAIKEAEGKYFKILDADDWFDTKELVKFIALLKSVDVDLVASSFSYEYEEKPSRDDIYDLSLCNKAIRLADYLKSNQYEKHLPMATLSYRTELLKENKITIVDKYYGDIDYNLIPLVYVETLYFTDINLYKYYIGREGQSTSLDGYNNHLEDYIRLCEKITLFYSQHEPEMKDEVRRMFFKDNLNVIRFTYHLLLSPAYSWNKEYSKTYLKNLDMYLKTTCPDLYKASNKLYIKKIIPYIYIWRQMNLNVFNLK